MNIENIFGVFDLLNSSWGHIYKDECVRPEATVKLQRNAIKPFLRSHVADIQNKFKRTIINDEKNMIYTKFFEGTS